MPLGLCYYYIYFRKKENNINTLIFLWLHHQTFYKALQQEVIAPFGFASGDKSWADVGCSTGLLTRLAQKSGYRVTGYDINNFSLFIAKILSYSKKNIAYNNENFHELKQTFDVVSATSLLSVVEDKKEALDSLLNLLKDKNSTLVIIEPTNELSRKNVYKHIHGLKSFWFYKGLLLWAKAREGKAVDEVLFENLEHVDITKKYYLEGMVCVRSIRKS